MLWKRLIILSISFPIWPNIMPETESIIELTLSRNGWLGLSMTICTWNTLTNIIENYSKVEIRTDVSMGDSWQLIVATFLTSRFHGLILRIGQKAVWKNNTINKKTLLISSATISPPSHLSCKTVTLSSLSTSSVREKSWHPRLQLFSRFGWKIIL